MAGSFDINAFNSIAGASMGVLSSGIGGVNAVNNLVGAIKNATGGSDSVGPTTMTADTAVLRGRDVLNSNLGTAYLEIGGVRRRIFELKEISATINQNKSEVQLINDVLTKHKCLSSNGTGNFTIYSGVPDYSQMIKNYINTHKGLYFIITFEMNDPESTRGRRCVTLYDCLIDQHQLGRLSTDSVVLDETMDFTFDNYNINTDFNPY